jgi:hypothetical protein
VPGRFRLAAEPFFGSITWIRIIGYCANEDYSLRFRETHARNQMAIPIVNLLWGQAVAVRKAVLHSNTVLREL